MTKTTKLSLAGGLALLAGIGLMTALHQLASRSSGLGSAAMMQMHQGMAMPQDMAWLMPLGPLAMMLTLGGVVLLAVSLARGFGVNSR